MTLLYTSPQFLKHDTGQRHPEGAARLEAIHQMLAAQGLEEQCTRPEWQPISPERLARVHDLDYAERLSNLCQRGGGDLDPDTFACPASNDVALLAAGAGCDAVDRVIGGEGKNALCLTRPPGHHALRGAAMGFCLYNNIALAARHAIDEHGLERVMIVDWDVHHGNGTQDTFYEDGRVGFLSIHRFPYWPGTGLPSETGAGEGLGTVVNIPVRFGTPREDYQAMFRGQVEKLAERMKPELILVSAGFDTHRLDPIGSLGLEVEDFVTLTQTVMAVADQWSAGRLVSILEGGYHTDALAQSVEAHLRTLLAGRPEAFSKAALE